MQPQEPEKYDAVMGGDNPTLPLYGAVLGGMAGVKMRFSSTKIEDKIAALREALKYGEEGLNLILDSLKAQETRVKSTAHELLTYQISKTGEEQNLNKVLDKWLPEFKFQTVKVNLRGKIIQKKTRQARSFKENIGHHIDLEMVYIPGGSFLMGSPATEKESQDSERPQHKVKIKPFFMGKYTITQAQWIEIASLPQERKRLDPCPSRFIGDNLPVEQVSWQDAIEFCARVSKYTGKNYRLPSEAEWEYACRAGTTTPFYYGETITSQLANYQAGYTYAEEAEGEYRVKTTIVGCFPPNAFGLYDMHGNVWEMCGDPWHYNYKNAPSEGIVWDQVAEQYLDYLNHLNILSTRGNSIVMRGGSWVSGPRTCRSAVRKYSVPRGKFDNIGFRVVCCFQR